MWLSHHRPPSSLLYPIIRSLTFIPIVAAIPGPRTSLSVITHRSLRSHKWFHSFFPNVLWLDYSSFFWAWCFGVDAKSLTCHCDPMVFSAFHRGCALLRTLTVLYFFYFWSLTPVSSCILFRFNFNFSPFLFWPAFSSTFPFNFSILHIINILLISYFFLAARSFLDFSFFLAIYLQYSLLIFYFFFLSYIPL